MSSIYGLDHQIVRANASIEEASLHNTSDLFTNFRHSRHSLSGIHLDILGWIPAYDRGDDVSGMDPRLTLAGMTIPKRGHSQHPSSGIHLVPSGWIPTRNTWG